MQKLITRASLFEKSSTEVLSRQELCRCDFILKAGPWKQLGARQGGPQALQGSWKGITVYSRRQIMRAELDAGGAGPAAAPKKSLCYGSKRSAGAVLGLNISRPLRLPPDLLEMPCAAAGSKPKDSYPSCWACLDHIQWNSLYYYILLYIMNYIMIMFNEWKQQRQQTYFTNHKQSLIYKTYQW